MKIFFSVGMIGFIVLGCYKTSGPEKEVDSGTTPEDEKERDTETGSESASHGESVVRARDLYPLAVGNRWTYSFTALGDSFNCETPGDDTVMRQTEIDGRQAFELGFFCGYPNSYLRYEGDVVEHYVPGEEWGVALAEPVEDGFAWSHPVEEFEWQSAGTVTVPAGTFHDCWLRLSPPDNFHVNTYCPGVGKVRQVMKDKYEALLVSYSLRK